MNKPKETNDDTAHVDGIVGINLMSLIQTGKTFGAKGGLQWKDLPPRHAKTSKVKRKTKNHG